MKLISKAAIKDPADNNNELGYLQNFSESYFLGQKLGKGGSGTVFVATRRSDNAEFAVKVIPKILTDPSVSQRKRDAQVPSIRQEIEVLLALRGTLNVAALEGAYEDFRNVYIVMELCHGGELLGGNKKRHQAYSERAVASFMRSILQTIAQCHALSIIHRDVKPENFLLLSKEEGSPLKAIDFGLAAFFTPDSLPITATNVEGTPWFLAPEACRAKWWPTTDVWAAGIIAAHMLTGVYPFVDRVLPDMPDLARTLRVICFEELNQSGPEWQGLSSEAVDFVASLLVKDPLKRPSATAALEHPFLHDTPNRVDRPLHHSVVQRIQRFAQNGVFKRRVLEHIARDLVTMHFSAGEDRSAHGGAVFNERSVRGARAFQEASRHGGGNNSSSSMMSAGGGRRSSKDASSSYHFHAAYMQRSNSVKLGSSGGGSLSLGRRGSTQHYQSVPAGVYLPVATPYSRRLAVLLDSLNTDEDGKIERSELQQALTKMGYRLNESEAGELFDAVDVERRGAVSKSELSASLVDWKWVQDTFADRWKDSVQRVFTGLDKDGDGQLSAAEIGAAFSGLCPYEVDAAVHEALVDAAGAETDDNDGGGAKIDFQHLLSLLQSESGMNDLSFFDDRLSDHTSRHLSGDVDEMMAEERRQKRQQGLFGCCFS